MTTVTTNPIADSLHVIVSIRASTYAEAVTELVAQSVIHADRSLVILTHVMASPEEHFFTACFE